MTISFSANFKLGNKIILLLLIQLYHFHSYSQLWSHRHLTIEDGLASNETYAIYQDVNDNIWIATDQGLSKFDGQKFSNYTVQDGLPDNTIFDFFPDNKGRVWFHTYNGKLGYMKNSSFYSIDFSTENMHRSFYLNKNQLAIESYKVDDVNKSIKTTWHCLDIDNLEPIFYDKNSKEVQPKNQLISSFFDFPTIPSFYSSIQRIHIKNNSIIELINSRLILKDHKGRLIKKIDSINSREVFIGLDKDNNYWYAFSNKNLYRGNLETGEIIDTINTNPYVITSVYVDKNNGIWLTSLYSGILYVPNDQLVPVFQFNEQENGHCNLISTDLSNSAFVYNSMKVVFKSADNYHTMALDSRVNKLKTFKNHSYVISSNQIIDYNHANGSTALIFDGDSDLHSFPFGFSDITFDSKSNMISCAKNHVTINGKMSFSVEGSKRLHAIKCVKDTIWTAGVNGLFCMTLDGKQIQVSNDPLLTQRIEQIESLNDWLVLSTRTNGIILKNKDKLIHINEKIILNNTISKIAINDSTIWAATNNGLVRIDLIDIASAKFSFISYGTMDGLISNAISDIALSSDNIYIVNKGFTFSLPVSYKSSSVPPILRKPELQQGNRTVANIGAILEYYENNITIQFSSLFYPDPNGVLYYYSIDNGITWSITENNSLNLPNLSAGKYSILIKACAPNGIFSDTKQLVFTILSPIWKTWWFILTCICIVVITSYLFYRRRIRRLTYQQNLKKELAVLEQKALTTRLNPHFVFNSINSIQYQILKKDKFVAYKSLGKFANLFRSLLVYSENQFISLASEIDFLTNYLQIEGGRFETKFDYTIDYIPNNTDINKVMVPVMLFQPFAENALRHGIAHMEGIGTLAILFEIHDDIISCKIEDNGVGRAAAKRYSDPNHESYSSKIIMRRIEIMNQLYKESFFIRIEDVIKNGTISGTRVLITLPLNYSKW